MYLLNCYGSKSDSENLSGVWPYRYNICSTAYWITIQNNNLDYQTDSTVYWDRASGTSVIKCYLFIYVQNPSIILYLT